LYFGQTLYILISEAWIMLYIRKYTIEYDIRMNGKDNRTLNSLFQREGIYLSGNYDSEMLQNTQGLQTVTHTETMYAMTLNNVENGLSFAYQSDARKAQEQLIKIFPDGGLFPISAIETTEEDTDLMPMGGENIVLSQWNDETEECEVLESELFERFSFYGCTYKLGDDTDLNVKFNQKINTVQLIFEITWNADKVARKDAIERRLIEKPLDLMSLIILKVENALQSQFGLDSTVNQTVDCKFESINHTSSECSPDIIQMVKDAKNELKQQLQEEEE